MTAVGGRVSVRVVLHRTSDNSCFGGIGCATDGPGYAQGRRQGKQERNNCSTQPPLLASGRVGNRHLDERIGERDAVAGSPKQDILARHAEGD